MKKKTFSVEDFKEFNDPKNVMMQLFNLTCSLCGIDEIAYTAKNAPKTLGMFAQEVLKQKPDLSDAELEKIIEEPIGAWQEVDDYNASIGMPTFVCNNCYQQLLNGEVQISDI